MKVNAIDISPLKCATHWLYFCAKEHPEIGLPKVGHKGKDSNFFGTPKFKTGYTAYEKTFPAGYEVWYDISPHYSNAHQQTVQQILNYNPDVKLTCMVRDPVERAVSHYRYYFKDRYKSGNIPSFVQAVKKNIHGIREWGKGGTALLHFLSKFNRKQMFITDFSQLKGNQDKYLIALFTFLNVDPSFKPKVLDYSYWKKMSDNKYYANDKVKKEMKIDGVGEVRDIYSNEYKLIKGLTFDDFVSI